MHGSILSLWLILSCVTLAEPPADDAADPTADLSEAKRLFDEGTVRYDAADFTGAIEVFTLALGELREQGVDAFRIRGLLLFNIGRAHMRAYEIDEEIEHLRQARSIFQRFIVDAEHYPDQVEAPPRRDHRSARSCSMTSGTGDPRRSNARAARSSACSNDVTTTYR